MKGSKIKLFSMFSGYGGAEFALKRSEVPLEIVGFSEVDPYCNKCKTITPHSIDDEKDLCFCDVCNSSKINYAAKCYKQNHGNVKNFGDCTKINPNDISDFDLLTAGFPCQTFSVAGNRKGFEDTKGTLFHEIIRILNVKKPKYFLLENVEGLLNHDYGRTFDIIMTKLKETGYYIKYKLLNSKNYGTPQNRSRIFIAGFLYEEDYDLFWFSEECGLNYELKDLLEKEVDKKYYLNETQLNKLLRHRSKIDTDIVKCITASDNMKMSKRMNFCNEDILMKKFEDTKDSGFMKKNSFTITSTGRNCGNNLIVGDFRYDEGFRIRKDNNSPTIVCGGGGVSSTPIISSNNSLMIGNQTRYKTANRNMEFSQPGISWCLTGGSDTGVFQNNSIRRLTPKECFRLMGFYNDEIDISNISDSQSYKLAGNGWEINVVSKIFYEMFYNKSKKGLDKWF